MKAEKYRFNRGPKEKFEEWKKQYKVDSNNQKTRNPTWAVLTPDNIDLIVNLIVERLKK